MPVGRETRSALRKRLLGKIGRRYQSAAREEYIHMFVIRRDSTLQCARGHNTIELSSLVLSAWSRDLILTLGASYQHCRCDARIRPSQRTSHVPHS